MIRSLVLLAVAALGACDMVGPGGADDDAVFNPVEAPVAHSDTGDKCIGGGGSPPPPP